MSDVPFELIRRELHRANWRACQRLAEMAAPSIDAQHCVVFGERETLRTTLLEGLLIDAGDGLRALATVHTTWLWARLCQLQRVDDAELVRHGPSPRCALGARLLVSLTDIDCDVRWSTPSSQSAIDATHPPITTTATCLN